MIRVYITAKIIHAQMLTESRVKYDGIYFTAKWNIVANLSSEKVRPVTYWLNDNFDDIARSDFVIIYAEPHDVLKTSLVEVGYAMAHNKPVYVVAPSSVAADDTLIINNQLEPWNAMCRRTGSLDEAIKKIKEEVRGAKFETIGRGKWEAPKPSGETSKEAPHPV